MCLRNFNAPLWELFAGNLSLLLCSLFYLAWWIVSFRPDSPRGSSGGLFIAAAFITGIAAIVLMSCSISTLSKNSKGLSVGFILLGGVALYFVLLLVTTTVFHRAVTSELIIIHIWAVLELSAIAVLCGIGRFGTSGAVVLAALVGIATVVGLICYILYYRLEGMASYRVGMVPLMADAFVMAIFLCILAVS